MHDQDHTNCEALTAREEIVERYRSLVRLDPVDVVEAVAHCFTEDARFESEMLSEPLVGHDAIAQHVVRIGKALVGATIRHHTCVQSTHRTARWCWGFSGPSGSGRGMDVARFSDDDRIELIVVFQGLLPPPT